MPSDNSLMEDSWHDERVDSSSEIDEVSKVAIDIEMAEFEKSKNTRLYQLMQKSKGLKMKSQMLRKENVDLDVLF